MDLIKKYWKFGIILGVLALIIIPFLIEAILLCQTIFPFNINIAFDREEWFSFLGSYIGAIATFLLGILALYQNKRYKELADSSTLQMNNLMKEIKEVIWRNNLPIINFDSEVIIQEDVSKPISKIDPHWKLTPEDGILHLKVMNSQLNASDKELYLLKKYSFRLKNLSDFPIQTMNVMEINIRDKNNVHRRFNPAVEAIQGFLDGDSSIQCEIEVYDKIQNLEKYNKKILDIDLKLKVTDSKGYMHSKSIKIVSVDGNVDPNEETKTTWSYIHIISATVQFS